MPLLSRHLHFGRSDREPMCRSLKEMANGRWTWKLAQQTATQIEIVRGLRQGRKW